MRELRDRPPLAVRIEPPKPAQSAAPRPAAQLGELPDPDQFAPATPQQVQGRAEETAPAPGSREKKGFFRQLFRK